MTTQQPKYLNKDQILQILNNTKDRTNRLMVDLLRKTGLRISEMLSLTPENINTDVPVITVKTLKRRKLNYRSIPIDPRLCLDLQNYISDYRIDDKEPIFNFSRQTAWHRIKTTMLNAGVSPDLAHPHTLRHSYAIHCLRQGLPFRYLHEYLGHSDVESTMIYTKILAIDSLDKYKDIVWE